MVISDTFRREKLAIITYFVAYFIEIHVLLWCSYDIGHTVKSYELIAITNSLISLVKILEKVGEREHSRLGPE